MRSTDHVVRSDGPHAPSRETTSARPNDSVASATENAQPAVARSQVARYWDRSASSTITRWVCSTANTRTSTASRWSSTRPRPPRSSVCAAAPQAVSGHSRCRGTRIPTSPTSPGYGEFIGQEFGLPAGTYVGFIYRPDDLDTARETPTTDSFTVRLDDGSGMVVTSSMHPINVPALDCPTGVTWGPRSGPSQPGGSLEVTRLDAFTGSTFLPTGEVVSW